MDEKLENTRDLMGGNMNDKFMYNTPLMINKIISKIKVLKFRRPRLIKFPLD